MNEDHLHGLRAKGWRQRPDGEWEKPKRVVLGHSPKTQECPNSSQGMPAKALEGAEQVRRWVVAGRPVAAPRMTQRDKWLKRPCVIDYRDYRDRIRAFVGSLDAVPGIVRLKFFVLAPKSWSKKKRVAAIDQPHRQRLDADNLSKSVLDALFSNDGGVWHLTIEKRWCWDGKERTEIEVEFEKGTHD